MHLSRLCYVVDRAMGRKVKKIWKSDVCKMVGVLVVLGAKYDMMGSKICTIILIVISFIQFIASCVMLMGMNKSPSSSNIKCCHNQNVFYLGGREGFDSFKYEIEKSCSERNLIET